MPTVKATVTLDDEREFIGHIYRIKGTRLGRDLDHLSFVAHLELSADGSETSMAPMLSGLDEHDPKVQQHITRILETVGVPYWEDLKGQYVIALFDGPRLGSTVKGIASVDGSRAYVTEDTFAAASA